LDDNDDEEMVFVEWLCVTPTVVTVSFSSAEGFRKDPNADSTEKKKDESLKWLQHTPLSAFLMNISDASLELNGMLLRSFFGKRIDVGLRVRKHYLNTIKRQLYKVVGSAGVLGSPINLFSGLGSGFYDFFHEPAKVYEIFLFFSFLFFLSF
jgi:vacuolar protein sorting-associated protein 13A/C